MKKIKYSIILLVFSFLFLSKIVYAAEVGPTITTIKNLGGTGNDQYRCVTTSNNGYVAIGQSDSIDGDLEGLNKGSFDGIIANYDFNYTKLWNKNFGGSKEDYFRGVTKSSNGSIAVGYSNSTDGDLTGLNKGSWDAIIVSYDSEGNVIWNKNFGGLYTDYFWAIDTTSEGYIVVGQSSSNDQDLTGLNKGNFDAIIVKYDFEGNVIWNKNFGGSNIERFYNVIAVEDGYIAVGNSASNDQDLSDMNHGMQDAIIVKYDFEGNVVWNKNFGGSNNDYFYGITNTNNGYTAVGSIANTEEINTATIVHYDSNGNQIWNEEFGGSNNDYFYSITNNLGNDTVAGSSSSNDGNLEGKNKGNADAILAQYDNLGNLLWNINIGGSSSETLYSIIHANSSYTSVGFSASRDQDLQGLNKGRQDAILIGFKEPFRANVTYSTTEPTTEPVTATIKTTEPIETPIGWTRIDDTTFTKEYTQNKTEDVVLKTYSGEEYTVTVSITNIQTDSYLLATFLFVLWTLIIILVILISLYFCYHCVC